MIEPPNGSLRPYNSVSIFAIWQFFDQIGVHE
jgi:hypothetical protein